MSTIKIYVLFFNLQLVIHQKMMFIDDIGNYWEVNVIDIFCRMTMMMMMMAVVLLVNGEWWMVNGDWWMVNGDEEDNNRNTNNVVMESYYIILHICILNIIAIQWYSNQYI